jgi:hypothetical protein
MGCKQTKQTNKQTNTALHIHVRVHVSFLQLSDRLSNGWSRVHYAETHGSAFLGAAWLLRFAPDTTAREVFAQEFRGGTKGGDVCPADMPTFKFHLYAAICAAIKDAQHLWAGCCHLNVRGWGHEVELRLGRPVVAEPGLHLLETVFAKLRLGLFVKPAHGQGCTVRVDFVLQASRK